MEFPFPQVFLDKTSLQAGMTPFPASCLRHGFPCLDDVVPEHSPDHGLTSSAV
ncbi:hypothetical protein SynBIOSE41_03792 [Synechococcus sp. BIOS-E4-1]|nr:hypothetical protein SynBIOSE41_03792 [Synechococcus sp. BIOS-E4-1]